MISNHKMNNKMLKIANQFWLKPGGKNNDNNENNANNLFANMFKGNNTEPNNLFASMFNNNSTNTTENNESNNLFSNLLGGITKGLGKGKGNGNGTPPGLEQIGKLMNIIQKLESSKSKNDVNNIKSEMDTFLESDLGINVNQLNENIKKFI